MKLNPEKYLYVGCIPVRELKEAPREQYSCSQMLCLGCHQPMWVSEKKRAMKKKNPKKVMIYCFNCLIKWAHEQELEPELMDISKVN